MNKDTEGVNQGPVAAPRCVGLIMDGSRRWAREKGLPTLRGHYEGYKKFREFVEWSHNAGISHIIAYAFSTENWGRSGEEVDYLMVLFEKAFSKFEKDLKTKDVRISFIGDRSRLQKKISERMGEIEEKTRERKGIHLTIAISYGGRGEIVSAVNRYLSERKEEDGPLTEDGFGEYLWTKDIPEPDLIIRTGGEQRLSNFLPWQSVYSELYFTDVYWPAFSKEDFDRALNEFGRRKQRRGK